MSFRFQKRIKLGKGFGLNISKSGISTSYRNKKGSMSTKGLSLKTGIPGLTYRRVFKSSGNGGCFLFAIIFLGIFFSALSCSESLEDEPVVDQNFESDTDCIDTNCSDYTSRAAAQAAYDADPDCRGDLDADNDGIACEEPGNNVRECPTTANCGCSNKPKSQCENDPCCRWIVGQGCRCN